LEFTNDHRSDKAARRKERHPRLSTRYNEEVVSGIPGTGAAHSLKCGPERISVVKVGFDQFGSWQTGQRAFSARDRTIARKVCPVPDSSFATSIIRSHP
jgi:hypothetical protein